MPIELDDPVHGTHSVYVSFYFGQFVYRLDALSYFLALFIAAARKKRRQKMQKMPKASMSQITALQHTEVTKGRLPKELLEQF